MTRDEARSLDAGTTVRYFETARKGKGAARFGRLLSTSGYRYVVAMARKLERAGINPETVTDYCALRDRLSAWEGEQA